MISQGVLYNAENVRYHATPWLTGDGSTSSGTLLDRHGNPISSSKLKRVDAIHQTDWQGRQLLYATARTNSFLQSSDMANPSWLTVGSPVRTANAAIAPDGTTSAAKIAASASGSTLSMRDYQNFPAGSYPLQFWLQAGIITQVMIFSNATGGGTAAFNLTGAGSVITTTGVTSGVSITKIGSYYLCKVTLIPTATGGIGVGNYGSVATGDYFYAWGGMSCGGVYIPTTTAAVTVTDYTLTGPSVALGQVPVVGAVLDWDGVAKR